MATITIDIPDELSAQLDQVRDRLPELLALSLQQPAVSAHMYRAILDFLATRPTPDEIVAFHPTPEMRKPLATLLARSRAAQLTSAEQAELDEFERIEHLIVLLKAGSLPLLSSRIALYRVSRHEAHEDQGHVEVDRNRTLMPQICRRLPQISKNDQRRSARSAPRPRRGSSACYLTTLTWPCMKMS